MDMQNVSNLQIPEGIVRTIHDKDNRLLWCRVAYDTKYAGDVYQYTYSGANMFNVSTFVMGGMNNGQITTSSYRITNITMPLKVYPNTSYTISVTLGGDIMGFRIGMHQLRADKSFISDSNWQQLVPNPFTFTTGPNTEFIGIVCSCSVTSTTVTTGTTESHYNASNPTQWLRGCTLNIIGNYVTPSPDKPELIQTVTGEQTITISDGVDSEAFPVSLGFIELCKIGNYQDYIYKSGADWYVHKAIGKISSYNGETITTDYVSTTGGLTNGATVYYGLATSADTKITDATLISQFNAIHEWLTRYGYNATVTGNLPLIVTRTNL